MQPERATPRMSPGRRSTSARGLAAPSYAATSVGRHVLASVHLPSKSMRLAGSRSPLASLTGVQSRPRRAVQPPGLKPGRRLHNQINGVAIGREVEVFDP